MLFDALITSKKKRSEVDKYAEQPIRSVVETLSWRVIGTLDTVIISFLITGELMVAFSIGSIELVSKMVLYFLHERAWNSIKWGK